MIKSLNVYSFKLNFFVFKFRSVILFFIFFLVGCGVNKNNVEIINVRSSKIFYKVKKGDTLNGIAAKHGTTVKELCKINNFDPFEVLSNGEIIYLVKKKEDKKNEYNNKKLLERNKIFKENILEKGNLLEIENDNEFTGEIIMEYDDEKASNEKLLNQKVESSEEGKDSSKEERFGLINRGTEDYSINGEEDEKKLSIPKIKKYKFPVNGKILRNFGEIMLNKEKCEGINIRAPFNVPVFSVADSYLLGSGELISGFGKMVILKHLDGMISVYAHLKEIKIKKRLNVDGELIKARTVVGTVGKTGNVKIPQLYFQLRNKEKGPVDPLKYLK